jgi:tetratricopeptide (TPR) repeat protein
VAIHLATRDPYHVREFNRGLALYDRGQYREAEASFTRAIDEKRDYVEALFWRARARQNCDRKLFALEDYQKAAELSPSPEVMASRAFCEAQAGVTVPVIVLSREAIRRGFASAEVCNNLGYAYSREGNFRQAVTALDEAIAQNPRLQAALHNRALAEFRWALAEGRPVDVRACADIEAAIAEGPATPELCVRAAHIYTRVAQAPGQYDEAIMGHLARALRLGAALETVRRDFSSVLDDTQLKRLGETSQSVAKSAAAPRLVDPITDRSFWRR